MRIGHKLSPFLLVIFFVLLAVMIRDVTFGNQPEEDPLPKEKSYDWQKSIFEFDRSKDDQKEIKDLPERLKAEKFKETSDARDAIDEKEVKVEEKMIENKKKDVDDGNAKRNDMKIDEIVVDTKKDGAANRSNAFRAGNEEKRKIAIPAGIAKLVERKLIEYRKAIEYEEHLQDTKKTFENIVKLAKSVTNSNKNSKIVLLSFVCKDITDWANNWLCNTKDLDLHSSLIMVTFDRKAKGFLEMKWPSIKVFDLEPIISKSAQRDKTSTFQKLQIVNSLLHAGINLLLFDVESIWFSNPLPSFKSDGSYDMLANFAVGPLEHVNTGFIVLFATERTQYFWIKLYEKLRSYKNNSTAGKVQGIDSHYEYLLNHMLTNRFGGISFQELPVLSYTEDIWYMLSTEERKKTKPIVIRNNPKLGFGQRVERAILWKHWFIRDGQFCDSDLVKQVVQGQYSVKA